MVAIAERPLARLFSNAKWLSTNILNGIVWKLTYSVFVRNPWDNKDSLMTT